MTEEHRIKIKFKEPEQVEITHDNIQIKVKPFISTAEEILLLEKYVTDYFMSVETLLEGISSFNYLNAEYNFINYLYQLCTNIDMEDDDLDPNIYIDVTLFDKVTGAISNYFSFRNKVSYVISDIKQEITLNNSVGKVLQSMAGKATELLDAFSQVTPEKIEELQGASKTLVEELKTYSVLGEKAPEV